MFSHTLLVEPHITIGYDARNHWLVADWHGNQNLASVQHGALAMLRLLATQRCHKVLNDNSGVTSMWSEAAEWAGEVWFPAMVAAGLRHLAWVYSPNIYSRLSTDLTLQFAEGDSVVATFDTPGSAYAWLARL